MLKQLEGIKVFRQIKTSLRDGERFIGVEGLSYDSEALMYYALSNSLEETLVIVAEEGSCEALYFQLESFLQERVAYLPKRNLLPYKTYLRSREIKDKRLKILTQLITGRLKVLILSPEALIEKYIPKEDFLAGGLKIQVGDTLKRDFLRDTLIKLGYESEYRVEAKGTVSVRGDIVDVFIPGLDYPVRLDFFDDEIEAIKKFDLETQKTIDSLADIFIYPASDLPILTSTKRRLELLPQDVQNSLKEGLVEDDLERFFPAFFNKLVSILDYVDKPLCFLKEPADLELLGKASMRNIEELFRQGKEDDLVAPIQAEGFFKESVLKILGGAPKIFISMFDLDNVEGVVLDSLFKIDVQRIPSFGGNMEEFSQEVKKYQQDAFDCFVIASTEKRRKLLQDFLESEGLKDSQLVFAQGFIEDNFVLPKNRLVFFSDQGILGSAKRNVKKTRTKKKRLDAFTDIVEGDYVVHDEYGISRYSGIVSKEILGVTKDYLKLEFAKEGRLFIPVEQMDNIEKYIGGEGRQPRLSVLGKSEWKKTKERVRLAVCDIAKDLLRLYSERKVVKGHAFSPDTSWQVEFENRFPYEETEDQMKAIIDVKEDMEKDLPMDRIVIGDVGYGKTEVAIRGAFKAAIEGKQVVVLCPTTVLSSQHYRTFKRRFEGFPLKIGVLNRFMTASVAKKTLQEVLSGEIDVLIGTHRVLSKDVVFKDLGLVIIDEEQKFGVLNKERLKALKGQVDCLTMSATPIPRTLHMALAGARDLSVIETAPRDRYPVQSYVLAKDEKIIASSIRREIKRGGQVYYVNNSVKDMEEKRRFLQALVPEVTIVCGHGQMDEKTLELNMMAFLENRAQVLLCTTIIENGLDIKNANTLIVENAHTLGLSQIYQLKGRVGRSNKLAYSYFMFPEGKILTALAKKRLKAIKELTDLGSGFKVAMMDLEIRGAGNLLGKEQHGHLLSVGFDLYCKILEEEVEKLSRVEVLEEVKEPLKEPEIKIDIEAYLPESYIKSSREKVEIYKKAASLRKEREVFDLVDEVIDRFGTPPKVASNLFLIAQIKSLCYELGIGMVTEQRGQYILIWQIDFPSLESLQALKAKYPKRITFDGKDGLTIYYKVEKGEDKITILRLLQDLSKIREKINME